MKINVQKNKIVKDGTGILETQRSSNLITTALKTQKSFSKEDLL